jgi:hypothetical protein
MLRPPDFAIVGAPRCGTTALYRYLETHPGITMSSCKEPRFFSSDIEAASRAKTLREYEALWAHAKPGTLRGEATPDYIQSQIAIAALLNSRPDAKLIAMLRNPVEIVGAHYAQLHTDGHEEAADLESAWRLSEGHPSGKRRDRNRSAPAIHYRAYAAIGDQLERFLALAPPDQRIVILYDDFKADTRREYLRVLALLELADDGRTEFPVENARRELRWAGLPRFQSWLGRKMPSLYRGAKAAANAIGLAPGTVIHRANVRTATRQNLRPEFERELIAAFLPQIEKVERLLGTDLSAWKRPRSG